MRTSNRTGITLNAGCLTLLVASALQAVPINGFFKNDPHCDPIPDTQLTHELGDLTLGFPIDEGIEIFVNPTNQTVCVPDDGIANDWIVRMVNVSPIAWKDLFFVSDEGYAVGNYDGHTTDLAFPGATTSFRIDGTVTPGTNSNLVFESGIVNEIFEPGEVWMFYVSNFTGGPAGFGPLVFGSVGKFAASSGGDQASTASILANPVPEPASLMICAIGGLALLKRRHRTPVINAM